MRKRVASVVGSLVLLFVQFAQPPPVTATTGPYTLPFFDPTNYKTQGCHQGCAYDYSLNYEPVAATRQGTVAEVISGWGTGACDPAFASKANYVVLRHSDQQLTFYLHLSTVNVSAGQLVSAGQTIATSGNSGYSCGAHLHYALYQDIRDTAHSLVPDGRWTTEPGRVPWLATWYAESNSCGCEWIQRYTTATHWVKFKNVGGRTWSTSNDAYGRGRIYLASTNNTGTATRNSSFQAADWSNAWLVTGADQATVPPNQVGQFTFGLYALPAQGDYTEWFNLRANSLWWFDYQTAGSFYLPIYVRNSLPPP